MANIKEAINYNECTGCGACKEACHKDAIVMQRNSEGFLYPVVRSSCINCGMCVRICPIINECNKNEIRKLIGGKHKNFDITMMSSSGAAFYLFANFFVKNGGYVSGVVFDGFKVKHILTNQCHEIRKMLGSKYVQSDMNNIYTEIGQCLKKGKLVLFTGSPCQVAGIKAAFDDKYSDKLYTMEYICHGVPSPAVWEEHIQKYENYFGAKERISNINFRNKDRFGWHSFELEITYSNNKKEYYGVREDNYYNGFLENLFLRNSCYGCKFKGIKRNADICVADFWGMEKYASSKLLQYDKEGVSLIALCSDKALQLFERVQEAFDYEVIDNIAAFTSNLASMEPASKNRNRKRFFKYREKYGTEFALNKYAKYTLIKDYCNIIKWKIWKIVGKI